MKIAHFSEQIIKVKGFFSPDIIKSKHSKSIENEYMKIDNEA